MRYEVLVCDWDGTLVDSEHYIVASLRSAAEDMGLPDLGHARYKSIIGLGLREALSALYPDIVQQDVERLRDAYARAFVSGEHAALKLFEGVEATLEEASVRGVRLAVATGKSRRGLERALTATGLGAYFSATRCADESRSKPDPLMLQELSRELDVPLSRMLMVGDTEFDLAMASAAGMPAVGVSYGVHDVKDLQRHAPLAIVDRFESVLDVLGVSQPENGRESVELASR